MLVYRFIYQDATCLRFWDVTAANFNTRGFLPKDTHDCPRDVCSQVLSSGMSLYQKVLVVVTVFITRLDVKPVRLGGGRWHIRKY